MSPAFTLVSCSAYFVDTRRTVRRYIPEDGTFPVALLHVVEVISVVSTYLRSFQFR
jgi:hypothetical protein